MMTARHLLEIFYLHVYMTENIWNVISDIILDIVLNQPFLVAYIGEKKRSHSHTAKKCKITLKSLMEREAGSFLNFLSLDHSDLIVSYCKL